MRLEIRDKGNWRKRDVYIPIFIWLVGLFSRSFKQRFYNEYFTTSGDVVYCPGCADDVLARPAAYEAVLRHEAAHVRDWKAYGVKFSLTYALSRKWRAYWEYRGYMQNMLVEYERSGKISDLKMLWLKDVFSGPMYFWMDTDPMPTLTKIRDDIYDFDGKHPDSIPLRAIECTALG